MIAKESRSIEWIMQVAKANKAKEKITLQKIYICKYGYIVHLTVIV